MKTKTLLCLTMGLAIASCATVSAQTKVPLKNSGFEEGPAGWSLVDNGMTKIAPEAARNDSRFGMRITDDDDKNGSSAYSVSITVSPGVKYEVTFWARYLRGNGAAVNLVFYDADKKILNTAMERNENITVISKGSTEWNQFKVEGVAPAEAATLRIWIHSFYAAKPVVEIDDIELMSY